MFEMNNYKDFYNRISAPFRTKKGPVLINTLNRLLTGITYLLYPLVLAFLAWQKDERFFKVLLIPASGFILLSLIRNFMNRKRPYESFEIEPLIEREKTGKSMPSRHVFSMTIIAMAFLYISVPLGSCFLLFSLILAALRVIGGVHYPSDVAVALLCGILMGFLFRLT